MKYGLEIATIQQIQSVFASYEAVEQAILYGSRAKGTYLAASDIDLTLKGEHLDLSLLHKISWDLDDLLLPYTIDLSIFHHIQQEDLLGHILRVGVVFYGLGSDDECL